HSDDYHQLLSFFITLPPPTSTLFPYTTLFRSRHLVGSLPFMFSSFRESCLPLSACISGWFFATVFQSLLLPENRSTRLLIAPSTKSYSRKRANRFGQTWRGAMSSSAPA